MEIIRTHGQTLNNPLQTPSSSSTTNDKRQTTNHTKAIHHGMSISLRIKSLCPIQENVTYHPILTKEDAATTATTCHICYVQPSPYTCPRCRIPYCSVACYRTHNTNTNSDCSEHFYEQRVSQILQLEVKEQSSQFRQQILHHEENRTLLTTTANTTTTTLPNDDDTTTTRTVPESSRLSREELVQVWSILERMEEETPAGLVDAHPNDDHVTMGLPDALQQHLSMRVQTVLRDAMQHLTTTPLHFNGNDDTETTIHETRHSDNNTMMDNNNNNCSNSKSVAEWILEPWSPWWCPNYRHVRLGNYDAEMNDTVEYGNDPSGSRISDPTTNPNETTTTTTLDERLWSVPQFSTLYAVTRPRRHVHPNDHPKELMVAPPQFPLLQFNLIEILLATVYTLRTYHGVENIVANEEVTLEAATTLVSASLVLRQDQRYTNLESVLMEICQAHHPIQQQIHYYNPPSQRHGTSSLNNNNNKSQMTLELFNDVALLYTNHRLVARALLEASDIVQTARTNMKRSKAHPHSTTRGDEKMRQMLRRIHKKILFYLSWTMAVSNISTSTVKRGWPYRHVSTDMRVWITGWQLPSPRNASSIRMTV